MVEHMGRATLNQENLTRLQDVSDFKRNLNSYFATYINKSEDECKTNNAFIVLSHILTLSACSFLNFRDLNFAPLAFMYRSLRPLYYELRRNPASC